MERLFVAIAGNVGVGKSSLTSLLTHRLGWEAFLEPVDENPYLADFYADMRRWSFQSQVFFLSRRLRHHHQLAQRPNPVVQDRSVYEDAEIFARNLYNQGYMTERDWASYMDLYQITCALLPPPTLVVYLQASVDTLLQRIAQRGREFERDISVEYLETLNVLYDNWASDLQLCPIVTISTDNLDFVHQANDLELVVDTIRHHIQHPQQLELL